MIANGPHQFTEGATVLRIADGMPADVLGVRGLRVLLKTRETFAERIIIEQGDPAWMHDCFPEPARRHGSI